MLSQLEPQEQDLSLDRLVKTIFELNLTILNEATRLAQTSGTFAWRTGEMARLLAKVEKAKAQIKTTL